MNVDPEDRAGLRRRIRHEPADLYRAAEPADAAVRRRQVRIRDQYGGAIQAEAGRRHMAASRVALMELSAPPEIVIRNFNFFYSTFQALDSISMTVPQHRITALIGASGCGKSTLLRAINRMHDKTPGAARRGRDALRRREHPRRCADLVGLRKRIGMIFQRSTAFPMSIYDNVAYGLRLSSQRCPRSRSRRASSRCLRDAGLVGRGEGQAQQVWPRAVRRPAAAAVHRAGGCGESDGAAHGRAVRGARSDLDAQGRGV